MDGRTIYTPIFSGVFWNTRDAMLEDVERIEVIRGPGAAMWGANAVNGIINIITKSAEDTQGGLISAGGGDEERGFGSLRYGGKMSDRVYYRSYVKYFNRDEFIGSSGENPNDEWDALQGGFRMDGDITDMDSFTLQGDIYDGDGGDLEDVTVPFPPYLLRRNVDTKFSGGNILGRWKHTFSDTSDMALQLYYDRTEEQFNFLDNFRLVVNTFDMDFQHRFQINNRQDLTWGFGFRYISDDINNASNVSFDPASRDTQLYSAFVQDEIALIKDRLKFILGSKIEHNDYTGFEIQPSGRILFTPHERHTVWTSISRAVRTPSRIDDDTSSFYMSPLPPGALFPGSPTALYSIIGDRDFDSEELIAYEIGYRFQPKDDLFIDIAVFYNDYDNLKTYEVGTPFLDISSASPFLVIPAIVDNKMNGETYGIELSAQWQALEWWRLHRPPIHTCKYNYTPEILRIQALSVLKEPLRTTSLL